MTLDRFDVEQSKRISLLERRMNNLSNDLAALTARVEQSMNILKTVLVMVALTLGIDVQGLI